MRTALAAYGDQEAMVEHMRRRQAEALYAELLAEPSLPDGVVYQCHRAQTGLRTIAIRHDALSERQYAALGEFRLHQYILCGYYDPAVIFAQRLATDPAFAALPPAAIHILVGTADGRLLAYFFVQPATESPHSPPRGSRHAPPTPARSLAATDVHPDAGPRMGDQDRPLFPSEYDTFSPAVYTSLPALQRIPVSRVRELARLLRNQAIQSPISAIAAVEAIYTLCYLTIHSGGAIEALIGNMGITARRLMAHLNNPMLYAPFVPVVEAEPEHYWIPGMNLTGAFWPFVASRADACASVHYYEQLDTILSLNPQVIRRALVRFNERANPNEPKALVPAPGTCPFFWTSDPLYGEERPASARARPNISAAGRASHAAARRDS